jgi:hypothetical protein
MRLLKVLSWLIVWIVLFLCSIWAIGAIYFDLPFAALRLPGAILFALLVIIAVFFVRGQGLKAALVAAAFVIVSLWWWTLKPSNDRPWQPDVAQTAWAEINRDEITLHNVRNCDYRSETDYTPRWETRTVRASQIVGIDIAITYWGSPWIAHPIISFRFADALPVCFSIETRKMIGQEYSAVRGFYRQFTLIYTVADERDPIRLRTNYRKGEEVYLYRTLASPEQARARFSEYIETLNEMHANPRWYNAVTTNCTTAIRAQRPTTKRAPWDWRILANGKSDELLYERKVIATADLPFSELKERSHINERARAADQDPDFSRRIREGVPGFQ